MSASTTVRRATAPVASAPATTAVVFATALGEGGTPAGAFEWVGGETLVERLVDQLRSLGIADIRLVLRPGGTVGTVPSVSVVESEDAAADLRYVAALAREGSGPVVFAGAEIITQREALAGLLADPRLNTGILSTSGRIARPYGYRTKTRRGRMVSAASPYHTTADPNQTFLGVLKVADADRPRLAVLADELAALRADPPGEWVRELDFCKAGTWKLAAERIRRQIVAREERLALEAAGITPDPEADDDPEASDEPAAEIERQNPDTIELQPTDAREVELRLAAAREEVPSLLLTALVRDGAQVGNSFLRSLFWARPLTAEAVDRARERIADHDEEAELLRSAVKASDGFFTTFFVSPLSKYVARACARLGLHPNHVTLFSMVLGVVAAALFATGERPGLVAGGIVAYFAFFFDCVDGQLARYARKFSKFGAWLDSIFDRSKEYVIFAGLALGAKHMGYDHAWVLACAAITLQTTRHGLDFSYPITTHQVVAALEHAPLAQPGDGFGLNTPLWLRPPPLPRDQRPEPPPLPPHVRMWRAWRRIGRVRGVTWVKKMITFPIGERFAVVAIVTAAVSPRTTFIVLLSWGGFACAYIIGGRLIRVVGSETAVAPPGAVRGRLESYRDDGLLTWGLELALPLAATLAALGAVLLLILGDWDGDAAVAVNVAAAVALGSLPSGATHRDRYRWLVPPLLRTIEFATIAYLATRAGHPEAGYAFIAAVCFRQYDLVYRLRHRGTEADRIVSWLGLGWGGRLLLVLVLYLADAIPAGLYVAGVLLALLWVGDAIRAWTAARPERTPIPMTAEEEEEQAG
jgi:hypothetical protein